ncbi:hypothetical protein [Faecalibacillus intestinalis]|uniref:hypothetical protein n=1 Tax=Faecalibacillus intestinalis TaxID=1982626 RepID=UPI00351F9DE0
MKIIKENNNIKLINDNESEIETYSYDKEINFKKLMEYLLGLNLEEKLEIIYDQDKFTDEDHTLLHIITQLIESYNEKVDEFKKFESNYNTSL